MVPILIDKDMFEPKRFKIHGPKLQLVFHQWFTNTMTPTSEVFYIVDA